MTEKKVKKRKNTENGDQVSPKKIKAVPEKTKPVEKTAKKTTEKHAKTQMPKPFEKPVVPAKISVDGEGSKKKKRPWRQVTRRKAKRQNKIENGLIAPDAPIVSEPALNEDGTKRKRKKKKKKDQTEEGKENGDKKAEEVKVEKKKKNPKKEEKSVDLTEKLAGSQFRYLNEQLYTTNSTQAEELFKKDKASFDIYHQGYSSQVKKWPANPLDNIIADLSHLPEGSVIADMGCGTARIAKELGKEYKVHSFDLVASNEHVTECNITKTPLKEGTADAVVYCLSLMGTNLGDFFREANRILKNGGKLKIAEVLSRFRHVKNFIRAVEQMGFELKKKKELKDFFVLLTFTKNGKVKQKRPTGLILEPCLYKKR